MVNISKKFVFVFSLIIFSFFFIFSSNVLADSLFKLPGIDCGMAGGQNGTDKCCYNEPKNIPGIPGSLTDFGGAKGQTKDQADEINKLQKENQTPCVYGSPDKDISNSSCKCILSVSPTSIPTLSNLCEKYLAGDKNENERITCQNCAIGGGLWTAIGCVPLRLESFVTDFLLRVGIGFAGFFAFICIIYAAFRIQTSQGNPEKVKKAQEMLTSCIMGLMLIIFSVFILRLIGVDILKLPGLSK